MRRTFIILGLVLGIVVAGGIFLFLQFSRPIVSEVPVAIEDIPAGTVLRANLFRIARLSNVDTQVLGKWVEVNEWAVADGKTTTSDIRAGFPVAHAQIDPNSSAAAEFRLSNVLTGTNDYYIVIPVKPDEVGNYVQPGDRVDLLVSIGSVERKETIVQIPPTTTVQLVTGGGIPGLGSGPAASVVFTQTSLPVTKLVMQNLSILRVERDRAAQRAANTPQDPQPTVLDVKRLYVRVTRDQLEVLSFVLNNGRHILAVRAANGDGSIAKTEGVNWDDFVRWFYEQRNNAPNAAQPFNKAAPTK